MITGQLTKIRSNHSNVRTDTMIGTAGSIPEVGQVFVIVNGNPIETDKGQSGRMIQTTEVIDVVKLNAFQYMFKTQNSEYRFDVLCDECEVSATHIQRDAANQIHTFCDSCWDDHVAFSGNNGKPYSF